MDQLEGDNRCIFGPWLIQSYTVLLAKPCQLGHVEWPHPLISIARPAKPLTDVSSLALWDHNARVCCCLTGGQKHSERSAEDSALEKGIYAIVDSFYKYAKGQAEAKALDQEAFQSLLSNELSHQLTVRPNYPQPP